MTDDLDDILGDGRRAEVEARFRELEQQEELERLRRGEAPSSRARPRPSSERAGGGVDDDLAGLKSKLGDESADDGEAAQADSAADQAEKDSEDSEAAPADSERYVLILCPKCGAKNRTSLSKVRTRLPRCGACKASLSFTKL